MEIENILPEIVGVSDRQIWYAEQLRHKYIEQNEERFDEIYEAVMLSNDKRNIDYHDDYLGTFDLEFTDEEKSVLFVKEAWGIIAALKDAVYLKFD